MSFHKTQYLELSSKVTRQLCLELLTWSREREKQCETAGKSCLNRVFLSPSLCSKNPPAKRETWVRSLGWEEPLVEGKATHSSILA